MANGYATDGFNGRLLNPDLARSAAAIADAAIISVVAWPERSGAAKRGVLSEFRRRSLGARDLGGRENIGP